MGAGDTRGQGVEKVLSGDGAIGETQGRYLILWGGGGGGRCRVGVRG